MTRIAHTVSVVVPAKDERASLSSLLPRLLVAQPGMEVIVVDDGSSDGTGQLAASLGARVVRHPRSLGNGAAIKTGARVAHGETLVFMDADGQHRPEDISRLVARLEEGHAMVVGARSYSSQAGVHRALANTMYNWLATWMTGQRVEDLTSGFRAVKAPLFRRFVYLLPNGFSYPTTITMSFFRAGFPVAYEPITAPKRIGKSHVNLIRDGARFFIIIFKIGVLYSPLKLFLPVSGAFFLTACSYYLYTYVSYGRFTNMSALLFITSVLVFLMGLVSEQISALNYKDSELDHVHDGISSTEAVSTELTTSIAGASQGAALPTKAHDR